MFPMFCGISGVAQIGKMWYNDGEFQLGAAHQVIKRWAGTKPQINLPLLHLHYQQLLPMVIHYDHDFLERSIPNKSKKRSLISKLLPISKIYDTILKICWKFGEEKTIYWISVKFPDIQSETTVKVISFVFLVFWLLFWPNPDQPADPGSPQISGEARCKLKYEVATNDKLKYEVATAEIKWTPNTNFQFDSRSLKWWGGWRSESV